MAVPFDIVVLFAWRCILVHLFEDLCTMKWIALVSGIQCYHFELKKFEYSCAVAYWYRGSWTLQSAAIGNWLCWTDCVSAVFCCRLARIDSLESCTQLEEKMRFALLWRTLAAIAAWLVRWVQTIDLQELTVSHQQPPVEAPLQAPHFSAFDSGSSKPSIHTYSVFYLAQGGLVFCWPWTFDLSQRVIWCSLYRFCRVPSSAPHQLRPLLQLWLSSIQQGIDSRTDTMSSLFVRYCWGLDGFPFDLVLFDRFWTVLMQQTICATPSSMKTYEVARRIFLSRDFQKLYKTLLYSFHVYPFWTPKESSLCIRTCRSWPLYDWRP